MRGGWVERGTVIIRLTRGHFAYFRAYLDGLDLMKMAERYLENPGDGTDMVEDLRIAKKRVEEIREQLAIAARRSGNPKSIRLLKLPPEKLEIQYATQVPTLEQFREERDPYEIYSEEDLIALFQEEYGWGAGKVDRRAARNDRLRTLQRRALNQLEELVAADPKPTDGVDGWLDPALAKRLKAAGIATLDDLVDKINGWGYRWYTRIPKIGEKAATQIVRWLTSEGVEEALGVKLHIRVLKKKRDLVTKNEHGTMVPLTRPARTDIVPLEDFKLPAELNGSQGTNRGDRPLTKAANDLEAIYAWLALYDPKSHTYRAYKKEAERFLLWSVLEKQKPISSLTVEDCIDYRDFLWYLGSRVKVPAPPPALLAAGDASPTPAPSSRTIEVWETAFWSTRFTIPQECWIGKRATPRWSEYWRPFEGKLNERSQNTALTILQHMMQWLTDQCYLHANPMKGMKRLTRQYEAIDTRRALTQDEWDTVKDYLGTLKQDDDEGDNLIANDKYHRLRFIIALAYSTGMRLSEMAALRRKHFDKFTRAKDRVTSWEAEVLGKGKKVRKVSFNQKLMEEIRMYFARRGMEDFEAAPPETPLIASLPSYKTELKEGKKVVTALPDTGGDPLTGSRIYDVLKAFFEDASRVASDIGIINTLKEASTHWMRHTYATHALEKGMELKTVSKSLGHASLATTSIYLSTERDRSSEQADEFGPTL